MTLAMPPTTIIAMIEKVIENLYREDVRNAEWRARPERTKPTTQARNRSAGTLRAGGAAARCRARP
jgi:hypothetical protein